VPARSALLASLAALPLLATATTALAREPGSIVLPPNPTPRPVLETSLDAATALVTAMLPAPEPSDDGCHQALRTAGANFAVLGRHAGEGQCGIDNAVELIAIGGVALQPAALLTCQTALTFAQFWSQTMAPEARSTLGSEPAQVFVAASYACRGRNNAEGARISEHAFGRAIDIRALTLEDGTRWSVAPRAEGSDDPTARFQARIRQAACGPFNTVLGPGSDGHHTDHIHFDTARRSSTYCR
jgi:hypothetical protein